MEPINIPDQAIEVNNGERVWISGGETKANSFEGMRTEQGILALIRLDERDREIINRTHCFWLGFHSKFIPVFSIRPADDYTPELLSEAPQIPVRILDEDFYTDARMNWPSLDVEGMLRGKVWVENEIWLQRPNGTRFLVEPTWIVLHNLKTGHIDAQPVGTFDLLTWLPPEEINEQEESNQPETGRNGSDREETVQPVFSEESRFKFSL